MKQRQAAVRPVAISTLSTSDLLVVTLARELTTVYPRSDRARILVVRPPGHLKQRTMMIDGAPVRRTVISIDSEKTGMRVELPLLPQLEATLDAGPTGDLAFIVTRRGTPWTKGALGAESVAAARAAGVVGKSAHGMRKATATRAAENGATEREFEAIFGWSGADGHPVRQKREPRQACGVAIGQLDRAETENRTSRTYG